MANGEGDVIREIRVDQHAQKNARADECQRADFKAPLDEKHCENVQHCQRDQQRKGIIHPDIYKCENSQMFVLALEQPEGPQSKQGQRERLGTRNAHPVQEGI